MSAAKKTPRFPVARLGLLFGILAILGLGFAAVDLSPDLSHLQASMLSGPRQGNYFEIVDRLSRAAGRRHGVLRNQATSGTVDNLERLARASDRCDVHFALAQDGVEAPPGSKLELIGRLQKSESVFFIGPDAGRLRSFGQLKGLKIGVGPRKSGTDQIVRQIFAGDDFGTLELHLSNHSLPEQLALLGNGQLELGAFVLDEDASFIRKAIRTEGMQLASFQHLDVIARQYPFLWHGRIGAGQYDPIRLLPPEDKRVLRVDTLVLSNGCANHAQTTALLTLLSHEFPDFVEHNRRRGESHLYPTDGTAQHFFDNNGPQFADIYAPWLVDIMPPSNWVYVVMAISLVFNVMGFAHRFRLWRIDANRGKVDRRIFETVGQQLTPAELHELQPQQQHRAPAVSRRIDESLRRLEQLRELCRKQASSMLVPMGQEMAYRYQQDQIEEALAAVRSFRMRLEQGPGGESS